MTSQKACILVAGGTGTRMGGGKPKQFLRLGHKPVIIHTVEQWLAFDAAMPLVVVMFPGAMDEWQTLVDEFLTPAQRARLVTVAGGGERTDSVYNGLRALLALLPGEDFAHVYVAIHDAVRPFAHTAMLSGAFDAAQQQGAAVCCVPVKASLRRSTEAGSEAVDRALYYEVQTPQVFRLALLWQAYENRPHNRFSDDASLVEAHGHAVAICPGSYDNIKLTTPEDMYVGEQILQRFQS